MNKLLKSFVSKRDSGASSSTSNPTEGIISNNNSTSQDTILTLAHLRKVFFEYQHPKIQWTQQDKNDRLYSTLPMVIKVLSVLSNNEWEERFPELLEYTLTLAKLLVNEIRLLRSLKLLSTGPNSLMEKFAQASLPSTFVKCLCLFFDLPEIPTSHSNNDAISPKEKRILLQQLFFQVK
jgi:hypothetical protein